MHASLSSTAFKLLIYNYISVISLLSLSHSVSLHSTPLGLTTLSHVVFNIFMHSCWRSIWHYHYCFPMPQKYATSISQKIYYISATQLGVQIYTPFINSRLAASCFVELGFSRAAVNAAGLWGRREEAHGWLLWKGLSDLLLKRLTRGVAEEERNMTRRKTKKRFEILPCCKFWIYSVFWAVWMSG